MFFEKTKTDENHNQRRYSYSHYAPPPDSERILAARMARRAARKIKKGAENAHH